MLAVLLEPSLSLGESLNLSVHQFPMETGVTIYQPPGSVVRIDTGKNSASLMGNSLITATFNYFLIVRVFLLSC